MTYFLIFAAFAAVTLAPRWGLIAQIRRWQVQRQRELTEDALKHLLDREQQGRHASPESLGGTLQLSPRRVMRLLEKMQAQNLVEVRGLELHLTAEGERWALQVVRAHRLWERYLADEARMPLNQIHEEAHRREHSLSQEEVDALESALGYPQTDPHGDPIPTREGTLAQTLAQPLTALQTDLPARIIHLEDEPAIAFEQILAAGLRLGQVIRLIEKTPQRCVLSDGENEYRLAPSVAANVHVLPLTQNEPAPDGLIPLWQLPHQQSAEIVLLDESVQGFTRRRFLDLGLTPGSKIQPELQNFFGDPRGYRVRGTLIALRREQAEQIKVKALGSREDSR